MAALCRAQHLLLAINLPFLSQVFSQEKIGSSKNLHQIFIAFLLVITQLTVDIRIDKYTVMCLYHIFLIHMHTHTYKHAH